MCSAAVQIHRGEGGGLNVNIRARVFQRPGYRSAVVTGEISALLWKVHISYCMNVYKMYFVYISFPVTGCAELPD